MNTYSDCFMLCSLVLICFASQGDPNNCSKKCNSQPVLCDPLSPPEHGSLNASDGNNLYSKVTYACDPGYSLKGPTRQQCLPVPYPNTAMWVPDEVTSCVKEIIEDEMSEDLLIVYDPIELADEDFAYEYFPAFQENVNDPDDVVSDADIPLNAADDLLAPPSLVLSAQSIMKPQMLLQPSREMDELCVRWEQVPPEYQCTGDQVATSSRWLVDEDSGVCIQKDFCGPDDEIDINGLFHTLTECRKKCMS